MKDSPASKATHLEATDPSSDRIWTIPNLLSFLRLLGVPLFLWLIFTHRDIAAIVVLAIASFTDFIDGRIARRFNQQSALGEVLDPAADRLYILATLIGLGARGIIPWAFLIVLLARDVILALMLPMLRKRGFSSLPANFIGKAATFCLLYALPLILIGDGPWLFSPAAWVIGWASGIWGAFLYWWSAFMYIKQGYLVSKEFPVLEPTS